MILRLLKAVFKISLLFACAIGLAYGFNVAMDTLLASELQIYDVAFVFPVESDIGYLFMRGVFYLFYDKGGSPIFVSNIDANQARFIIYT